MGLTWENRDEVDGEVVAKNDEVSVEIQGVKGRREA